VGNWFLDLFEINMKQTDSEMDTANTADTTDKDNQSNSIDEDLQKDLDTDDNNK
jgi:hypothetical protein